MDLLHCNNEIAFLIFQCWFPNKSTKNKARSSSLEPYFLPDRQILARSGKFFFHPEKNRKRDAAVRDPPRNFLSMTLMMWCYITKKLAFEIMRLDFFFISRGTDMRSSTAFIWLTPICWTKSDKDDIKSMTFLMSHMIKENDSMTFSHDVWFFKSASFFDTYSLIKSDDWVKSIVMMTWFFWEIHKTLIFEIVHD